MSQKLFLTVILLVAFSKSVNASSTNLPNYYPWITFLSSGPIKWIDAGEHETDTTGTTYRVVVTTSEIYDTVRIEKITLGFEGCCVKFSSVQKLDLRKVQNDFGMIGEISGFKFQEWTQFNVFRFSFNSKNFEAKIIGPNETKVHEVVR
tara:strand:+ start:196 stop:642 length:447 start_codon:yes stop_codon:yes gene_type:complete